MEVIKFRSQLLIALERMSVHLQSAHNAIARLGRDVANKPRRIQEALRGREKDLRELLTTAVDAVVVTNGDHRLVAANHQALDLFGVSELNMRQFTIDAFLSQSQIPEFDQKALPFIRREKHGKCEITSLDGNQRTAEYVFVANVVPRRHLYRFLGVGPHRRTQFRFGTRVPAGQPDKHWPIDFTPKVKEHISKKRLGSCVNSNPTTPQNAPAPGFSGNMSKTKKPESGGPVSINRHRRTCTVCRHEKCAEIEADFVNWKSPASIAEEYGLADRASIYRHAHALGLIAKRQLNIRAALERIIEKAGEVEVTWSAVVAAVQAYAKINAQGQWIDRSEHVNLNELFERMSRDELEAYAKEGALPDWFAQTVGAIQTDDGNAKDAAQKARDIPRNADATEEERP